MPTIRVVRSFTTLDGKGRLHGRYRVIWENDSLTAECLAEGGLHAKRNALPQGSAATTRRQVAAREHLIAGICLCGFFGNFSTTELPDHRYIAMGTWTAVAVCLLSGKVRYGSTGARGEFVDVETLYVKSGIARTNPGGLYKLYQNWGARVRIIVVKYLPVMLFKPQLDGVKNVHDLTFGTHLQALRAAFGFSLSGFAGRVNSRTSRATGRVTMTVARLTLLERDRNVPNHDEAAAIAAALNISMKTLLTVGGKRITLKRRRRGGIKLTDYQQQLIRDHVPEACAYVKGTRLRIAEGHRGHDILSLMQRIHYSQKTTGQKASVSNLMEKLRNEMGVLA